MSAAIIPKYSDICQSLIKQYWRYDSHLEPITELQVLTNIAMISFFCKNFCELFDLSSTKVYFCASVCFSCEAV